MTGRLKRSSWLCFIRDFGDALGGVAVGYGIAINSYPHIIVGSFLILSSIFIRFYLFAEPKKD